MKFQISQCVTEFGLDKINEANSITPYKKGGFKTTSSSHNSRSDDLAALAGRQEYINMCHFFSYE